MRGGEGKPVAQAGDGIQTRGMHHVQHRFDESQERLWRVR